MGGKPLGDRMLVKGGAHRFPSCLHLGFPSAAARARHLIVPIDHGQEALVHPLPPARRQDEWRQILVDALPPDVHQRGEGKDLLADPEVLRHQYEQGRGDPAVDVQAEHERTRLERKLAALEREKTRLLDAYQAAVIELTELAERRERLTEQGQLLRARVQEIEQQRLDRAAELRLLEGVEAFCASIRDAMVAPSFEVKQKVLQLIVQRIVVEDHRITIEHVVPSGPIRLQPEHHMQKSPM